MSQVSGRWSLVYSTKDDGSKARPRGGAAEAPLQAASSRLYQLFFKFAPFLAGSQDSRPTLPSVRSTVSNEQEVDVAGGRVDNRVRIEVGGGAGKPAPLVASIRVFGETAPDSASPADLKVTFTGWEISLNGAGPLRLPLPRPTGVIRTTFCDEELRIGRGGQGGVFVTRRLR